MYHKKNIISILPFLPCDANQASDKNQNGSCQEGKVEIESSKRSGPNDNFPARKSGGKDSWTVTTTNDEVIFLGEDGTSVS